MILALCDEATVQAILDHNERPGFTKVIVIETQDQLVLDHPALDRLALDHPASAFVCVEGWVFYERATQVA